MWLMPGLEIIPKVDQRRARTVGEISNQMRVQLKRARWLRWKKLNPEKVAKNTLEQNRKRKEAKAKWRRDNKDRINAEAKERRKRRWELTPPTKKQAAARTAALALWAKRK